MFEFLKKAMSPSNRPTSAVLQAELKKSDIFTSLTEQTQKDVLSMLNKASEIDLFDALHQIKAMTSSSRDSVINKLLHPTENSAVPEASSAAPAAAETYTVKEGDSLSKIAQHHGVSLKQVIAANPQVKNPNLIHPREVINLP